MVFSMPSLAGLGWGMNVASLAAPFVASGHLVPLVPDAPLHVPLFWHWSRAVETGLRDLTASIVAEAERNLGVS